MKSGVLIIAIVLIAIGVVSLAYQGITYTTREKIAGSRARSRPPPTRSTRSRSRRSWAGWRWPAGWSCSWWERDASAAA